MQTVTYRLADSLPRSIYDKVIADAVDDAARRRHLDATIDEGRGACLLRDPRHAAIVREAFEHFDGERYRLIAWVVMPNHVHVTVEQIYGFPIGDVIHAWKSFTAKAINKCRGANGAVWAPDYVDRVVRNERHFANAIGYIENNPVKAGLARHPEDWPYSSAAGSAGGTPAVPGKSSHE
ncbi:MAG TPA: transposase [Rhizomicrobium sp.]|nr:transposase [Rhizomicrobium sp.]